ncbi:MAG: S24 family peptidase [Gammaproteobacteria bacterium]|nr:S24 family peptidase [Gammaproteobacteria bacterium]
MSKLADCGASEPFALRVIGNDMAPEFCDGHIVVVDPGGLVKPGCFVVAQTNDDIVLRQLRIENGRYCLAVLNKENGQTYLDNLDGIIGIVSQRAGRRRQEAKRYDV